MGDHRYPPITCEKLQKSMMRDGYVRLDSNGLVKIAVPEVIRDGEDATSERVFPRERLKTAFCFLWLISGIVCTTLTISFVHEWVPKRQENPPLPDIFFQHVDRLTWAFRGAEVIGMTMGAFYWVMIFFHKHRLIILRRSWILVGLLYMLRCVTMFVTVLPVPDTDLPCSDKVGFDLWLIFKRALQLMSGAGLSITGVHNLCGDYIFSGHTFMLTMTYLFIKEYTPQTGRKFIALHWLAFSLACLGVLCVMAAHEHYTVDIIIAYWIATRLFWYYHTVANNKQLQKRGDIKNFSNREFWFPLLEWSERNVMGVVPNQFEYPLTWPR